MYSYNQIFFFKILIMAYTMEILSLLYVINHKNIINIILEEISCLGKLMAMENK